MLEANRNRKCDDLVQFNDEAAAKGCFRQLGVSYESSKKYRSVECPTCKKWHVIHISETMEGT